MHQSLCSRGILGLAPINIFNNWHNVTLYLRGHLRDSAGGRGIFPRGWCVIFLLSPAMCDRQQSLGYSVEFILQHLFAGTLVGGFLVNLLAIQQAVFCFRRCSWHFSKLLSHTVCYGHILLNKTSRSGERVSSFKCVSSLGILAQT